MSIYFELLYDFVICSNLLYIKRFEKLYMIFIIQAQSQTVATMPRFCAYFNSRFHVCPCMLQSRIVMILWLGYTLSLVDEAILNLAVREDHVSVCSSEV